MRRAQYGTAMGHERGGWGSSRLRITVAGPTGSTFLIWEAAALGGCARPKGGHGGELKGSGCELGDGAGSWHANGSVGQELTGSEVQHQGQPP